MTAGSGRGGGGGGGGGGEAFTGFLSSSNSPSQRYLFPRGHFWRCRRGENVDLRAVQLLFKNVIKDFIKNYTHRVRYNN